MHALQLLFSLAEEGPKEKRELYKGTVAEVSEFNAAALKLQKGQNLTSLLSHTLTLMRALPE